MQIAAAVRPKGAPQKYHVYVDPGDGLVHGQNNRTGITDHTGSTSDAVLAALLTDLGSTAAAITLSDDPHALAANVTIPENVGLTAVKGTSLKPASGKTLTLDGHLDAGPYQIFDLSAGGTVVLGPLAQYHGVYPEWWGTDTDAIISAIAASTTWVNLFAPTYTLTKALGTVAVSLRGGGKYKTVITKAFDGDVATLGTNVTVQDLTLTGDGANHTGRAFVFATGTGQQTINRARIIDFESYCLDFTATDAGSQFASSQCEMWRTGATTGSGKYAINIFDAVNAAAHPRKWAQLETNGMCAVSFGGCNDLYISDSTVCDLLFSANSRSVHIGGTRWLNQAAATILGANHTLAGNDIFPQLTLGAGAVTLGIGDNSYNQLPIIDNSGAHNLVSHPLQAYTTALTSGGTAPALGNGTLTAFYTRDGGTVTLNVNLQLGSTTTLGSGGLSFSLPFTRISGDVALGTVAMKIGTTQYSGFCQIAGLGSTVALLRDTSGSVTFNSPATFASGDTIRLTITYTV